VRTTVEPALRPLFILDDANSLTSDKWSPVKDGAEVLPTGCDGHGTAVSSLIGGRGNNGIGVAGVGYDVPLVGLRAGWPWDKPRNPNANNGRLQEALGEWKTW